MSELAKRVTAALWVIVATFAAIGLSAPIVVAVLVSAGVLRPGRYYPDAWAWPTIFTVAFALAVSANALVWVRVVRMVDREGERGRRAAIVTSAVILLAIGSVLVIGILAMVGIGVYFQLPEQ